MADGIAQDSNVSRPQVPDLNASGVAWALEQVAHDYACIAHERCAALWTRKRRVMCDRFEAESRPDAGAQATQVDGFLSFEVLRNVAQRGSETATKPLKRFLGAVCLGAHCLDMRADSIAMPHRRLWWKCACAGRSCINHVPLWIIAVGEHESHYYSAADAGESGQALPYKWCKWARGARSTRNVRNPGARVATDDHVLIFPNVRAQLVDKTKSSTNFG